MYETRGSYWNCIETIIYYPIHALSFRANFPRIFPFPRIRFFEKRKPGRDRIAPPTMNESLSIRVGREPNVNRRKRKKGAILNENRRGIADRRERERERGAVLWSVRRFISTERGKDVRLFFSWPLQLTRR